LVGLLLDSDYLMPNLQNAGSDSQQMCVKKKHERVTLLNSVRILWAVVLEPFRSDLRGLHQNTPIAEILLEILCFWLQYRERDLVSSICRQVIG